LVSAKFCGKGRPEFTWLDSACVVAKPFTRVSVALRTYVALSTVMGVGIGSG